MSTAAAVHATPSGVLLAAADEDGVTLLVALPAGTAPGAAVAGYLGDAPPEVVVLVEETAAGPEPFPGAPRVLPVPLAVAVLATGPPAPPGPVLVVEACPSGLRGWVVHGPAVTRVAVPGPGDGRSPAADRLVAAARACGAREVVLAGELAGTPGPATFRAALTCPVRPAGPCAPGDPAGVDGAGPATAAVLGAALLGAALPGAALPGAGPCPAGADGDPARPGAGAHRPGPGTAAGAAGEAGPRRRRWPVPAAALLGAVLVAAGLLAGPPAPAPVAGAAGVVQYGYAAALPQGWEHTGGDPARMRTLLTPAGRPDGADLIVLERSPLGYDAGREPARAARELAALLAGAPGVTGPAPRTVGGRAVLGYTQRDGGTVTDWHVLLEGTDELVAGCRRPAAEPGPGPACAVVVGSLRRAP